MPACSAADDDSSLPSGDQVKSAITMLQAGTNALKYSRSGVAQAKLFTLSDDASTLSWRDDRGGVLGSLSSMTKRSRSVPLTDVEDVVLEERTAEDEENDDGYGLSIRMRKHARCGRASLDVVCLTKRDVLDWVSALNALTRERIEQRDNKRRERAARQKSKQEGHDAAAPSFGEIRERYMAAQLAEAERKLAAQEELEAWAIACAESEQTLAEAEEELESMAASSMAWAEAEAEAKAGKERTVPVQVVASTRNKTALLRARKASAATRAKLVGNAKKASAAAGTKNVGALARARMAREARMAKAPAQK